MNKTIEYFKQQIGQTITQTPSPVGLWLKGKLIDIELGSLTADIVVREEMTNPAGMLHGGSAALICDELMGAAVASLEKPNPFVSVNLHTEFLRPIRKGDTIRAKSEIIRNGKNVINAECKIYTAQGKLAVKSQSNLTAIQKPNA
jgi:uncharacterized protein (TIGR00369 family)